MHTHEVWVALHAGIFFFAVLASASAGHTSSLENIVLAQQVRTAFPAVRLVLVAVGAVLGRRGCQRARAGRVHFGKDGVDLSLIHI